MIVVLFEVEPLPGQDTHYFDIAASLREALSDVDGFVSVERFQSLTRPGVYLSMSWWRDEESVLRWRTQAAHRAGQAQGRDHVFANYRIRVAQMLRDYGQHDRQQAPADSRGAFN